MGRRPCIALLVCICSCSLDTTPDIGRTSERDASVSPQPWQQASLRFDAPRQPRTDDSVKRNLRDDSDAGDDAKPQARDAGRPASARPATPPARDAGSLDASDHHAPTDSVEPAASKRDASDDQSQTNSAKPAKTPSAAGDPDTSTSSQPSDAAASSPDTSSQHSEDARHRRDNGKQSADSDSRQGRNDGNRSDDGHDDSDREKRSERDREERADGNDDNRDQQRQRGHHNDAEGREERREKRSR